MRSAAARSSDERRRASRPRSGSTVASCRPRGPTSPLSTAASSSATGSSRPSGSGAAIRSSSTEHLARLRRSATGLGIVLAADLDDDSRRRDRRPPRRRGAAAGRTGDASVRITVSRGAVRAAGASSRPTRTSHRPSSSRPGRSCRRRPATSSAGSTSSSALSAATPRTRSPPSRRRRRADYVFARLEAERAGADDALFLTVDGFLSEATTANVFLVRGERSRRRPSPARSCPARRARGSSAGASGSGCVPDEGRLTRRRSRGGRRGVPLAAAWPGSCRSTRFDGRPIGDGPPGPWTRRARADREAWIDAVEASRA